ncbi:MAG: AMP-binding protein [Acidobacteria bacterium]|nr:AMP-binding protein [Acidobacteriota bacterium]
MHRALLESCGRGLNRAGPMNRPFIFWRATNGASGHGDSIGRRLDWEEACRARAGLFKSGVRAGDHVLVIEPQVRPAVTCLFGLWALGAVPIQIGLPFRLTDRAAFFTQLVETARRLDARFLLTSRRLAACAPAEGVEVLTTEDLLACGAAGAPPTADGASSTAFIQLTSGATSRPRGVVIPHDRLLTHLACISRALPSHAASLGVSWLPLHHDMGLVGGLLFPCYNGFPVHLISTADFQRRPWLWLEALARFRATISVAPPSAYAACLSLAPRLIAAGLDLSALECAMVGAEPISAPLLRRFSRAFAPGGFRSEAFFPVYGLAEATVAVSFPDLLSPTRVDRVDRVALEREGQAVESHTDEQALEFVGVGRAIPGSEIRIVDESGATLPERRLGEILARAETLSTGYYGEPSRQLITNGWLHTGDLGYQADGALFVTGRKKELIIKGGHNLIPSVLEELVASVDGVRAGGVAAVGVRFEQSETELVCIVAETRLDPAEHEALGGRIRAALKAHGVVADHVALVPPRSLPKTTSGKIQRLTIASQLQYLLGPPD